MHFGQNNFLNPETATPFATTTHEIHPGGMYKDSPAATVACDTGQPIAGAPHAAIVSKFMFAITMLKVELADSLTPAPPTSFR